MTIIARFVGGPLDGEKRDVDASPMYVHVPQVVVSPFEVSEADVSADAFVQQVCYEAMLGANHGSDSYVLYALQGTTREEALAQVLASWKPC